MNPRQKQLWHKIKGFQLDEHSADFRFSDRLARENGWTLSYTKRVIEEYKKFIFLCCISPTGVTPSDPVDQAWHLHLTYTQSYWGHLCRDILQKEIHHHPTQGGVAEASKFNDYYSLTHQLYKAVFEMDPPADIWQSNQLRFTDINFQRVNKNNYWLIRKSKIKLIAIIFSLLSAHFLFVQASYGSTSEIVMAIIAIFAAFFLGLNNRGGGDQSGCSAGGGCDSGGGHHGGHGCSNGHGCSGGHGCSSGCSGGSSGGGH